MRKCKVGIIGCGRIGQWHAENIHYRLPQFTLIGIADPQLDLEWAQSLQLPFLTAHYEDLLDNLEMDAIIIASPSHCHTQHIIAASQVGKAVFCEKPLGLFEEDILKTLSIVERNNTLLQIGFNRRFDMNFAYIQNQVRSGKIGIPHLLRITSRDPVCPSKEYIKHSGGIFMDMTIHDFDMARFLLGSEVIEVFASGTVLIHSDFAELHDVDTAVTQLRFANGALGIIDNSRKAVYGYDQRVEVFGEHGVLSTDNQTQHAVRYSGQEGTSLANPLYFFLERYRDAYLAEMEAFYKSWHDKKPSAVTGWDGLQALRIATAAKLSLEQRIPIQVEMKSEKYDEITFI